MNPDAWWQQALKEASRPTVFASLRNPHADLKATWKMRGFWWKLFNPYYDWKESPEAERILKDLAKDYAMVSFKRLKELGKNF